MRLTCIRRAIGRIPSMRASSPRMWPTNPLSVHCRAQKEAGAIRARPYSKRQVAGWVRRCRLPAVHSTEEKKWTVEVLSYWVGGVLRLRNTLGQAFAFCLGAVSARSVHALGRTPPQSKALKVKSGSDTTTYTNENEVGGCAKGGLRRNEEEPELGEGCLPSPKQEPPRAPLSRAECEEQAAQRNKEFVALAETARGGCRG